MLADSYTLYLKTHNYHWNVTGPMFHSLHLLFEEQYNELALAVDLVAERIRALDAFAPASYREFASRSTIVEEGDQPDATEMIRRLVAAQDAVIHTAKSIFPGCGAGTRRTHRRPPHPAHPGTREGGLDAPQLPCLTEPAPHPRPGRNPI